MLALLPLEAAARAPAELTPEGLAAVLAVMTAEIVGGVASCDGGAVLERIANRLDNHGRRCAGDAAAMVGAVGAALMRLET